MEFLQCCINENCLFLAFCFTFFFCIDISKWTFISLTYYPLSFSFYDQNKSYKVACYSKIARFANFSCLKVCFWRPNLSFRWLCFSTQIFNIYFDFYIFKILFKLYRASKINNTTILSWFWKFLLISVAKNVQKAMFFRLPIF